MAKLLDGTRIYGSLTVDATVTATSFVGALTGNASTVTNGVYTSGSYSNPSWITSLSETKVLPSQTSATGKFLTSNGTSTSWTDVAAAGGVIYENSPTLSSNYTISTGKNGMSVGPITIASGVTVTVPSGQRWIVL